MTTQPCQPSNFWPPPPSHPEISTCTSETENLDLDLETASSNDDKKPKAQYVPSYWATDPKNPQNWSARRKWAIVTLLWGANMIAFVHSWILTCVQLTWSSRSISSTAFEPALPSIMADFGRHNSNDGLASFTVSIYSLGYCFGPLFVAPTSEIYGRVPVLFPGFAIYLLTLVVCARSNNIVTFLAFRCMIVFAGIAFLICGRAVIAHMIEPARRGLAVSFMTSGPTLVSPSKEYNLAMIY